MIRSRLLLALALACALLLWFIRVEGRLAVVSALLLFGPGFLLERALPGAKILTPLARPTIWLGLSISLVALLYEWVTALGLFLNELALVALAIACLISIVWVIWTKPREHDTRSNRWRLSQHMWIVAFTFCLLLTLGVRFYQVRNLLLPAWVDSVHHALLIRVAMERGQAPISLYPYLPIQQLPYHWGYHVFAAASAQLARVSVPQVMLWQGQMLNALHVLTCAALANYLLRRPWAGVVAGLAVGLLSLMPAFYTSWGRYTQLTGLLLLPPLAICWHALLHTRQRSQMVLVAVLLAGLSVVHFRVLIFALCFLAVLAVVWALDRHVHELWPALTAGFAASLGALLLTAPWLWLLLQRRLAKVVEQPQSFFQSGSYGALNLDLLWSGLNPLLAALALAGALWGLHRHSRAALSVALWVAGLATLANPQLLTFVLPAASVPLATWAIQRRRPLLALAAMPLLLCNPRLVHLPSSWLITNDVVVITLFVPFALLTGALAVYGSQWLCTMSRLPAPRLRQAAAVIGCCAIATWGAWNTRDVIRPSTVLASEADVAAIEWVAAHTPPDARFLINAAPWLSTADRGVDGGWWLLPLTGRWTSTPPVIFDYGPPEYVRTTREQTHLIANFKPGQEQAVMQLIEQQHIGFIYLKEGAGPLTREDFSNHAQFVPVYDKNGVIILAVVGQT